jgi:hypothetical protein
MSIKDTSKQDLRSMLLKNGTVTPGTYSNTIKHIDIKASQAAAIAARRNEMNRVINVTRK